MSPRSTGGRYGMTFVLIPGAGGEAWYWHRLVAELKRRGHDAVAVELPAGDDGAGWAEYAAAVVRSEEHTSELQSHSDLVCRLLLAKKKRSFASSARVAKIALVALGS